MGIAASTPRAAPEPIEASTQKESYTLVQHFVADGPGGGPGGGDVRVTTLSTLVRNESLAAGEAALLGKLHGMFGDDVLESELEELTRVEREHGTCVVGGGCDGGIGGCGDGDCDGGEKLDVVEGAGVGVGGAGRRITRVCQLFYD